MGWKDWQAEEAETMQTIIDTVRDMHDTAEDGPLPGSEEGGQ